MELNIHVALALASIISATATAFQPSKTKFLFTYILTAGAFISGFFLLFTFPEHIGKACVSGLLYIGSIMALLHIARRKVRQPTV